MGKTILVIAVAAVASIAATVAVKKFAPSVAVKIGL